MNGKIPAPVELERGTLGRGAFAQPYAPWGRPRGSWQGAPAPLGFGAALDSALLV